MGKMDIMDMGILGRLLNDCRESDRQIGRELGVSGGTVRARIGRMQEAGVIEDFFIRVEPAVLGYGMLYFVVSGEDVGRIEEQARLVGKPFLTVPCVGGITVWGIVIRRNLREKVKLASRLMSGIRVLAIFEADSMDMRSDLTKTDWEVLGAMIEDPRGGIKEVAGAVGLSPKTVARSIEKMRASEGIQFTLVYDPRRIEGYIAHAVLTSVRGDPKRAIRAMNRAFSGSYLQAPFIANNQVVLFMYSRSVFEMDEVTGRVGRMADVSSVDLFIPKKITFHTGWLRDAIADLRRSPTLHLGRHTG